MVNKIKNKLSVDEIKNSDEYQCRKHHIKINLYIWLLISCIALFIPFVLSPEDFNNKKVLGLYDEEMDKFYIIKLI